MLLSLSQAEAETADTDATAGKANVTGRSKRLSIVDARGKAVEMLTSKGGHRDRKSGAFALAGPEVRRRRLPNRDLT